MATSQTQNTTAQDLRLTHTMKMALGWAAVNREYTPSGALRVNAHARTINALVDRGVVQVERVVLAATAYTPASTVADYGVAPEYVSLAQSLVDYYRAHDDTTLSVANMSVEEWNTWAR